MVSCITENMLECKRLHCTCLCDGLPWSSLKVAYTLNIWWCVCYSSHPYTPALVRGMWCLSPAIMNPHHMSWSCCRDNNCQDLLTKALEVYINTKASSHYGTSILSSLKAWPRYVFCNVRNTSDILPNFCTYIQFLTTYGTCHNKVSTQRACGTDTGTGVRGKRVRTSKRFRNGSPQKRYGLYCGYR